MFGGMHCTMSWFKHYASRNVTNDWLAGFGDTFFTDPTYDDWYVITVHSHYDCHDEFLDSFGVREIRNVCYPIVRNCPNCGIDTEIPGFLHDSVSGTYYCQRCGGTIPLVGTYPGEVIP
jgi:hypothetical protein